MSVAQAVPLDPRLVRNEHKGRPATRKPSDSRVAVDSVNLTLSGIVGVPAAATNVGKAVGVVQNGVATGATKVAAIASNHGCNAVAAGCLKVAAAASVIAQVIVCVAIVAIAFGIFWWLRSA